MFGEDTGPCGPRAPPLHVADTGPPWATRLVDGSPGLSAQALQVSPTVAPTGGARRLVGEGA